MKGGYTVNSNSFDSVLNEYWQIVYRFCLARTGNEDMSRDMCGEVFLILCKKQPNFKSLDALKVWLIKTARYIISNERKLSQNTKTVALDNAGEIAVSDPLAFELCDLLSKLPEKLCDVTVLYYIEDMDIRDIAKALSIPEGTVKSRLSRARTVLSKIYKEEIL